MFSSFISFLKNALILDFADAVLTKCNQSKLGPLLVVDVIMSTMSPVCNLYVKGTIRLFTLAPIQWFPTSECILYARSTAVEPTGRSYTSPFGVKTKTSSSNTFIFTASINSSAPPISLCASTTSLNHLTLLSSSVSTAVLPSLYFQCAAIPYSAIACISCVLICISNVSLN